MGVKDDQEPVAGREKEIQRYLQRMERVLTQAERMHSSTHVQPARRRHSLSNSQESLKAVIGSMPDDSSHPSSPDAPSAPPGHALPPQHPDGPAQAQESGPLGRLSASPQRQQRGKSLGTDPGDLMRQTARDGRSLLDTSATLADWIMRSTSSSAGASQRESDEAAELAAELVAAPADVAYSSLVLESLSEWALKPDNPSSNKSAPGPFPRQRSPVSFPVALSESASMSCATSSPVRPPRVSHAGRPSASFSKAAASACAASDTDDTADSGSPQDQQQSSGDSKVQQSSWKPLLEGEIGTNRRQTAMPAKFGSSSSAVTSAARPGLTKSPGKPDVSSQNPSPSSRRNKRAVTESGSPGIASSRDMQPAAAYSAKPRGGGSDAGELGARQEACTGRGESAPATQQVPALQKLKLRVRSRHRSSSQGTDLPRAFQDLQLTDRQLLSAAGAAPPAAPASAQMRATERGAEQHAQDGGKAAAGRARSATIGTEAAPVEEQYVFKASRTLPRSPLKGTPQPPAQASPFEFTPTKPDAASECEDSPHKVGSPIQPAQPECAARPVLPADSHDSGADGAIAELSPSQQCSSRMPDLALSPHQQPESPPGSGVLAVNSLVIPAVRKAQRSSTPEESAIFTPSHKLARSPPRQQNPFATSLQKDAGGQLSPCSFPQELEAEELPETPRMRAAAQNPTEKHAGACMTARDAGSPAQKTCHWTEDIVTGQRRASAGPGDEAPADGLPKLPMLGSNQLAQPGHAGAAPSRLPRPPSATSPRPAIKRPQSGGASKLPSAPAGQPTAQSGQPTKGSASHTRKALQQADLGLGGSTAQPVQAILQPGTTQRSHFEIPSEVNTSPGRRRNVGDTLSYAAGGGSIKGGMPDKAVSGSALRSAERSPDKDRRRSSAGTAATDITSSSRRSGTPPAAADAEERQLSGHLRAKQSSSGSPPEKSAMKRRLSLGAPQRIRSPAQPNVELPGNSGIATSAAKSGSAEAPSPKGSESPTRSRLQGSHVPARPAQAPSRLQGAAGGARKPRTRASAGRDTVLSAVGKLPIDVIMGSMHGALMD